MEKYHIYEEIGKGEFSQVFKGREKKKIEYAAIKRIEKSAMAKTVNEVQILHKLNHTHIMKFHDWYETRSSLWLILEYCTGGDLDKILRSDGHLPETSVRIFGLDMLTGLKYLHSVGFIHNDLRPKNFLIDEYGILKLSDFKYATKIPKEAFGNKALEERGIPSYMAPECFTKEGVASFQSDFWGLGCVLYELRRGVLPFGDLGFISLDSLRDNIRSIDPIQNPVVPPQNVQMGHTPNKMNNVQVNVSLPSISCELVDMLMWLLEKAPMNRCNWNELCAHPFWAPNHLLPPTNLPPQPAFEALVRELERSRSEQLELASQAEFNLSQESIATFKDAVAGNTALHHETPLKLPPAADCTPMRPEGLKSSRRRGNASAAADESKQLDDGNSRPPLPQNHDADKTPLRKHSVQPDNPTQPDNHTPTARIDNGPTTASPAIPSPFDRNPNAAVGLGTPVSAIKTSPSTRKSFEKAAANNNNRNNNLNTLPPLVSNQAQSSILSQFTPQSLLIHSSDTQVKPIVGNKTIETIETMEYNSKSLPFDDMHGAELINKLSQTDLEIHLTQVYKSLHKAAVACQAATTSNAYNSNSVPISTNVVNAFTDRVNILAYLCNISYSAEVANVVLNTHFLHLILKLLKQGIVNYTTTASSSSAATRGNSNGTVNQQHSLIQNAFHLQHQSRYLCATILALMLRYATFIQPPSLRHRDDHIVQVLVGILKENLASNPTAANTANGKNGANMAALTVANELKFRKRLVAALGEIVFYISSQDENANDQTGTDSEAGAAGSTDKWVLPLSAVEVLGRCLKDDNEEVVKHYAAKTFENVLAQGGIQYRRKMVSYEITASLLDICQQQQPSNKGNGQGQTGNNGNNEHLQATCAMAVSHVFNLVLSAHVTEDTYNSSLFPTTGSGVTNTGSPNKTNSMRGTASSNAKSNPPTPSSGSNTSSSNGTDPFQSPIIVSSAKFVAKILEKAHLPSMIEILNDGSTRLQQAYLTWFIMILILPFTNSDSLSILQTLELYQRKGKSAITNQQLIQTLMMNQPQWTYMNSILDSSQLLTIYNTFTTLRSYFLRVHSNLIPILFRLVEQGSILVIRGKALLALQALCLHMPGVVVSHLPERRFTTIFLRVLEPYLSALPAVSEGVNSGPSQPIPAPTYMMKVALSMMVFLRNLAYKSMLEIANYLTELANMSIEQVSSMLYQYDGVGSNGGGSGPNTEVRSVSSVGGKQGSTSVGGGSGVGSSSSGARAVSPNKAAASRLGSSGVGVGGNNGFAASSPQKKGTIATSFNGKSPSTPNNNPPPAPPTTPGVTGAGGVPENINANAKTLSFAPSQLKQCSELLRGILSLLSQPTLCRLVLCREELVVALTRALQELPKARSTIVSYPKKAIYDDLKESVMIAEQACLAIVESISQIEISEPDLIQFSQGILHPTTGEHGTSSGNNGNTNGNNNGNLLQTVLNLNYGSYIQYCVTSLIPAVSNLLSHPDNDLRAIVINMLRHILPYYLRQYIHLHELTHGYGGNDLEITQGNIHNKMYAMTMEEEQLYSTISMCLQGILAHISNLLTDESPIPQYMIRLVVETMQINAMVASKVVTLLKPTGGLNILIHLLKVMATTGSMTPSTGSDKSSITNGQQDGHGNGNNAQNNTTNLDPQLLLLLRLICETSVFPSSSTNVGAVGNVSAGASTGLMTTGAHLLIECDLSASLYAAMATTVFSLIIYPFGLTTTLQQPGNEQDIMVLLIDLCYAILHFVLKQISQTVDGNAPSHQGPGGHAHGPNKHLLAQQLRKLISPLQNISSALLMLVGYCDYFISNYPYGGGALHSEGDDNQHEGDDEDLHQNLATHQHLLDCGTRCLGMLFDLFPDVITTHLLSRQSIVPSNQSDNGNAVSSPQRYHHQHQQQPGVVVIPARLILAKLLKNRRVDSRVIMKVLKILLGVTKISMHGGAADRAKEVLNNEPMASALQVNAMLLQSTMGQIADSAHQAQFELLQSIGRIASQIIEIGSRL